MIRLKFLAYNFPTIMLNKCDQSFINISLCIDPLHFVSYKTDDYLINDFQFTNTAVDNDYQFNSNFINYKKNKKFRKSFIDYKYKN